MNQKQEPNQIAITSPDGREARLEELRRLFPDLFDGEGLLDEKALRQLVAEEAGHVTERFRFEWAGKGQSKRFAFAPSKATLVYDPERSVNADGSSSKPSDTLADNTSENLVIEGDNLEVLKLLQASYFEKVKCIYIDPPYNTGRNYIYPNDYSQEISEYWESAGYVRDGVKLTANPETSGRFHSAWLNMMYSRLLLARKLLSSDGVLVCAIDENEHATLSILLKEIFGVGVYEHAYVSIVHNPRGQQGKNISYVHENMIIIYPADGAKHLSDVMKDEVDSRNLRDSGTESDREDARNCFYPFLVKDGTIIGVGDIPDNNYHPEGPNLFRDDGIIEIWPITDGGDEKKWRYAKDSIPKVISKLEPKKGRESIQIIYHKDEGTMRSVWQNAKYDSSEYGTKLLDNIISGAGFTYPKSLWAVHDVIDLVTRDHQDAIVMDFFAGSGTTGHAVMQKNAGDGGSRKYICVQIPEMIDKKEPAFSKGFRKITDITIERLKVSGRSIAAENRIEKLDTGFRVMNLNKSFFPQNTFMPDPEKSETENIKALEDHLTAAAQMRLFEEDEFHGVVTEIALKNGFGLFYTLTSIDEFTANAVYRLAGNDKDALLCLDGQLNGTTIEALKAFSDDQLIVLKAALDTTKKFELQTAFKDNLWVV